MGRTSRDVAIYRLGQWQKTHAAEWERFKACNGRAELNRLVKELRSDAYPAMNDIWNAFRDAVRETVYAREAAVKADIEAQKKEQQRQIKIAKVSTWVLERSDMVAELRSRLNTAQKTMDDTHRDANEHHHPLSAFTVGWLSARVAELKELLALVEEGGI